MTTENIKNIETYEYSGTVYNLEVEPNHELKDDQYYVCADTGIVIHNCHPRDNIALRHMAKELNLEYDLFDAIMNARDIQAKNLATRLVLEAAGMPIIIHGKSYKPGVAYLDGSYSLLVGHYCEELGNKPSYVDPLTGDNFQPTEASVFLLAHSASVTYQYTGKQHTDSLYCDIPEGSIVIDPWRKFIDPNLKVIHYGNTRTF